MKFLLFFLLTTVFQTAAVFANQHAEVSTVSAEAPKSADTADNQNGLPIATECEDDDFDPELINAEVLNANNPSKQQLLSLVFAVIALEAARRNEDLGKFLERNKTAVIALCAAGIAAGPAWLVIQKIRDQKAS